MRQFKMLFLLLLATLLVFGVISQSAYAYTESTSCSGFSSIAGQPGAVILSTVSSCDDCTELVTLPFTFYWYGDTPITQVQVSSNGQINMDPTDTNSNCCSVDPVEVGGAYTMPRIAVAQEDLHPGGSGNIYTLDTGSSFIIEYDNVGFCCTDGNIQAQVELFPNGNIEIRWGSLSSVDDNIAVGVEDDTRAVPAATPATGAPFGSGGIAPYDDLPQNQCRLFVAPGETQIPTLSEWGIILMAMLLGISAFTVLRRKTVN